MNPDWLRYSEVFHGRWAMLGAAGCIAPEILGKAGLIPQEVAIPWYEVSVVMHGMGVPLDMVGATWQWCSGMV